MDCAREPCVTPAHAPLSRHLSRFSFIAVPAAALAKPQQPVSAATDGMLPTIDADMLEAEIETARAEVRAAMEADFAVERVRLAAASADTTALAVAAARAECVDREGATLADQITSAFATLRDDLAGQVAGALRPLLTVVLADRVIDAVKSTLERALADPNGGGGLRVSGPEALLAAIEAKLPPGAILSFAPDEGTTDVSITGRDICIRSRLTDALATLSAGEGT